MSLLNELQLAINDNNKPELAEQPDGVQQVWFDGEVTCQKSGDLLWQRTLHQFEQPILTKFTLNTIVWPDNLKGQGFIFTDEEGCNIIREIMTRIQEI